MSHFFQARIFVEPGLDIANNNQHSEQKILNNTSMAQPQEYIPEKETSCIEDSRMSLNESPQEIDDPHVKNFSDETDKEAHFNDGNTSCLATCTTSDREDDHFHSYSYAEEEFGDLKLGPLTSCVGTRWYRAPELLYGSTNYGSEIDLWSLGCIFAELLGLKPLFPGNSDIDQLSKIITVLGNLTEETWPGCVNLPDYGIISFNKVINPVGLEACLPNQSVDETLLVKKLLCYDPASRATAMELLHDKYFNEEPLPAPIANLRVPDTNGGQDPNSSGEGRGLQDMDSDSDFDDFAPGNVSMTNSGFSIRFP